MIIYLDLLERVKGFINFENIDPLLDANILLDVLDNKVHSKSAEVLIRELYYDYNSRGIHDKISRFGYTEMRAFHRKK